MKSYAGHRVNQGYQCPAWFWGYPAPAPLVGQGLPSLLATDIPLVPTPAQDQTGDPPWAADMLVLRYNDVSPQGSRLRPLSQWQGHRSEISRQRHRVQRQGIPDHNLYVPNTVWAKYAACPAASGLTPPRRYRAITSLVEIIKFKRRDQQPRQLAKARPANPVAKMTRPSAFPPIKANSRGPPPRQKMSGQGCARRYPTPPPSPHQGRRVRRAQDLRHSLGAAEVFSSK